ncbi:MAG: TldD/PmbA family protein [Candidatus Mcinerneyibacterium aminivorans]|uniref:TldD/PmbA family protein n=1 Tax=Candidatus Mcinerneyibacterium aminivorans TaxID=2703815 RepID=A0A5D0MIY1_9BACT|nr:MAG: TldD/PmbA family protein [Candidatus Mcinerneyibacterium aminivorans]
MFDGLKKVLRKIDADYADIRYEKKNVASITYNGRELKKIGENFSDGYVIRVLKNGGFSSVSFTKEKDAEQAIKNAVKHAEILGSKSKNETKLADVEIFKDNFKPNLKEDPREVDIDEKLEILKKYNNICLNHDRIINTTMSYFDLSRERYFLSTEGAEISEELVTTGISGRIMSKDGNVIQNVRAGVGGSDGFHNIRGREEVFEKKKKIAIDLLNAEPVKGGTYNCIINPSLTGVFTHEAFGHFSEADIIEDLPEMRKKMQLGAQLGSRKVNIIDDPTMPGQLGFYRYDDEGVKSRKVQLMKNGKLVGRLHSRRTAHKFDEPVTGHTVAEDYRYAPIVRMGNIYLQPGEKSFDDLLKELDDGLYLLDAKGGQTAGENFTFGAQYGYVVKNGKIKKMVRDINISGNLYKTLKNISAVGNDFKLGELGGCGKGQMNRRSCHGGPHIIIDNLIVGGV